MDGDRALYRTDSDLSFGKAVSTGRHVRRLCDRQPWIDLVGVMTKPIRIQRKRTKGWRMPPNTVCVTRPRKWGNPLRVGMYVGYGRADAVRDFMRWLKRDPTVRSMLIRLTHTNDGTNDPPAAYHRVRGSCFVRSTANIFVTEAITEPGYSSLGRTVTFSMDTFFVARFYPNSFATKTNKLDQDVPINPRIGNSPNLACEQPHWIGS
jgi:hypothetical protein